MRRTGGQKQIAKLPQNQSWVFLISNQLVCNKNKNKARSVARILGEKKRREKFATKWLSRKTTSVAVRRPRHRQRHRQQRLRRRRQMLLWLWSHHPRCLKGERWCLCHHHPPYVSLFYICVWLLGDDDVLPTVHMYVLLQHSSSALCPTLPRTTWSVMRLPSLYKQQQCCQI